MFNILKLFFLFYFVSTFYVFADNCSAPTLNCYNIKAPYKFCYTDPNNNNKKSIKIFCVKDPLNPQTESSFFAGPLQVMKFPNMPVCLELDNSSMSFVPDSVTGMVCGNGVCGHGRLMFHKSFVENDIKFANDLWRCLCYPKTTKSNVCNCTIKVKFVNVNINEFENPADDPSSNSSRNTDNEIINNNCKLPCDNLIIYLNHTNEFTHRLTGYVTKAGDYANFYMTSDVFNSMDWPVGRYDNGLSIRGVIAKELGNIFGFGHNGFSENQLGGCLNTFNYVNEDIMYNEPSFNLEYLSDYDKCMFKKLYCPVTLEVRTENENNNYNNLKSFIDFNINFDKIAVFDLLGNKIAESSMFNFNFDEIKNIIEKNRFNIINVYKNNLLLETIKVLK